MEPDPLQYKSTRKVKYAPRAKPRPPVPKTEVKTEEVQNDDSVKAMDLLRRISEGATSGRPKIEKKVTPSQVAFGYGGKPASIKSYGGGTRVGSTSGTAFGSNGSNSRQKEYVEPWNYYENYPTSLPLRRPYSGDPEILDEEEFGEAAQAAPYDEDSINAGEELGLTEYNEEPRLMFIQLPPILPMMKQLSVSSGGGGGANGSRPPAGRGPTVEKPCDLKDLPAGLMGKMIVYKNGAVKLKLGDNLYDVSPGSETSFQQDVFTINTEEKKVGKFGELNKRAIITPDVDALLSSLGDF